MISPLFHCFISFRRRLTSVPSVASSPRCAAAACRAWKTAGLQTSAEELSDVPGFFEVHIASRV